MRWPWRRSRIKKALVPPRVSRHRIRIRVRDNEAGLVLAANWLPPVLDYFRSGLADGSVIIVIRVSATTSAMAEAYVQRQLDRSRVAAISVEAC